MLNVNKINKTNKKYNKLYYIFFCKVSYFISLKSNLLNLMNC